MTNDNFCFYLLNRLFQTSQTGGQWSPFSIPCLIHQHQAKMKRDARENAPAYFALISAEEKSLIIVTPGRKLQNL